jgi:hypothetical protein
MAEFGGFRGRIAGLIGGIANFLGGIRGITAKDLLRHVTYLQDQTVKLESQHVGVFWSLGRALGGALATIGTYLRDHLREFAEFVGRQVDKITKFLREKFARVLAFLKTVKDHINAWYKQFIRPIIDTIEFIRHINRVLQIFHVDVLGRLDRVLGQIEDRIEAPFDWTNRILTEVQNAIDRILTLDGLVNRIALLKSLDAYAPEWMRAFWEKQGQGISPALKASMAGQDYPLTPAPTYGEELGKFYGGRGGEYDGLAEELAATWREAAGGVRA